MEGLKTFLKSAAPSAAGAVIGSAITLFVVLVAIPWATAPHAVAPGPCTPPSQSPPGPQGPMGVEGSFPNPYDPNATLIVVFEVNTGRIHSMMSYMHDQTGTDPQPLLAENEAMVDISGDPHRGALMDWFGCSGQGEIPWRVDAWNGVLVPA